MSRDPVRAISQTGVFVLFYLMAITILATPLSWLGGALVETCLTTFLGSIMATYTCWKIYAENPLPHFGLGPDRQGARDFLWGVAAGAIGVTIVLVPGLLLHVEHFSAATDGAHVTFGTAVFVTILIFCGAAGEEMLFHGFAFQSLMINLGPFAAILPVAVIFGLLHMGNPDATWLSSANTAGFGIVFGYAVYRTQALWLPIGMHFGWNIAMPFFGVKLSGITMRVTGYEMTWSAGPLWSGGAYGPEGGLLASGVLVLMMLFVWRYPFPRTPEALSEPVESEPSV
jgi:membrane protease YdiL (CAAX protease family)